MNDIDVLIPTLRRPEHLARALRSVFAQADAGALIRAVVVIDNSPEASARELVDSLRPGCPAPLVFVHAPRPGVATARNAGLAASAAPLVAFLDDDEEAPPAWLGALRAAHLRLGTAVTFGPVRGVAAGARAELRPYLDRFFSREGPAASGPIDTAFGCGNSMMTRAVALGGPEPFDVRADLSGGEDDRLFTRLRGEGAGFGWAADAVVYEHAPAHRATLAYAFKRAFCYGQSPSQKCLRARDRLGLARCMAIGAGQASVYGLAALALLAAGRRLAAVQRLDQAVRGLGKVLWPVQVRLYGLAAAPPVAPGRAAAVSAPRRASAAAQPHLAAQGVDAL